MDAVYRMTVNIPCFFDDKPPVVLDTGTVSPFNSQNTAFIRPVFPLLYLPASVSFRSTDIIRGLVAQPILWSAGYSLGFTRATVVQDRNEHQYLSDFESEIPCYLHAEKILNVVEGAVSSRFSIETNLVNAYESLIRHELIPKCEMDLVLAWVRDIQNLAECNHEGSFLCQAHADYGSGRNPAGFGRKHDKAGSGCAFPSGEQAGLSG